MSSSLRVFLLMYFRLVAEAAEANRKSMYASSLRQPTQLPFPGYFDKALLLFDEEQKRY